MVDLLPSRPDTSAADDGEPRVVGVDSDDADEVLAALSSSTARELLTALHDEPGTASDLADRVDTSLQNVQYHLGNLEDAEIVEVIDTAYSEKGREMKVYAPVDQPLVVFAGDGETETGLRAALSRLIGGLGAVAGGGLLVQALAGDGGLPGSDEADGGASGDADEETYTGDDDAERSGDGGDESGSETGDDGADASSDELADDGATDDETTDDGGTAEDDADAADDAEFESHDTSADADDGGGIDLPFDWFVDDGGAAGADAATGLPPGLLFFAGGATVVIAWFAIWYLRAYRA